MAEVLKAFENVENQVEQFLIASISSVLFVSPKPISVVKIARVLEKEEDEIKLALDEIKSLFSDDTHGFSLHEVAGGYQFKTGEQFADTIKKLITKKNRKLTQAASETLAMIAYKQPIQRAEIEAVRGVDALPTLKTLLDARLVRIVGRENTPGHPALYGTTDIFLEKFGLKDLSELPTIRELEEIENDPGEVEEVETNEDSTSEISI